MAHPAVAENAGRNDHIHGDEDLGRELTAKEEVDRDRRADELIAERLQDRDQFADLMAGIDSSDIDDHLQRALNNLDAACRGSQPHIEGVLSALHLIQRRVKSETEIVWRAECIEQAERELAAGEL